MCYEVCPTLTYGLADLGECVSDIEGPENMYGDDVTHRFIDADTCRSKNMFIYTSTDEQSRRCVV